MTRINAQDQLDNGTRVLVGTREGVVVSCVLEDTSSNSGGKVAVHEIEFTHRRKRKFGKSYRLVPLDKAKREHINYAGIVVLA